MTRMITYMILSVTIAILALIHGAVWIGVSFMPSIEFSHVDYGTLYLYSIERRLSVPLFHEIEGRTFWREDGEALAIFSGANAQTISIYDLYGNRQNISYDFSSLELDDSYYANWSPDGNRVRISGRWDASDSEAGYQILYLGTIGTEVEFRLVSDDGNYFRWSPDSERIIYLTRDDNQAHVNVYHIDSEITDTFAINALWGFFVEWWDDNHLVFVRDDGIYRINVTTGNINLLWHTGQNVAYDGWANYWSISPDHTRLNINGVLYRVDEVNTDVEILHEGFSNIHWSPDSLMFMTRHNQNWAYFYDRDGNLLRTIDGRDTLRFAWRPQ